jgi:hypothetical protein
MKLTPWFPQSIEPVHVGVYETKWAGTEGGWFNKWDGLKWCRGHCNHIDAHHQAGMGRASFGDYKIQWRGLARKPK